MAFEWADSYDNKDWERLKQCLAPSILADYRGVGGPLHMNATPDEFADFVAVVIGDKRLQTQHLIGASKWLRLEDGAVHAWHQVRAAHQRYDDESLSAVANKGHGHGVVQHMFRKIEGKWKLEGIIPTNKWSEYDLLGTVSAKTVES